MKLIPIRTSKTENTDFLGFPDCLPIIEVMEDYYKKIGYHFPWVGYFALEENESPVGTGGFKGAPINGKIEIAYSTFKGHEGKGNGTTICQKLVDIAQNHDTSIIISARTLPIDSPSCSILRKNGFINQGIILDPEDGEVFEWIFQPSI